MGNYSDRRLKRAAATITEPGGCEGARYAAIWHLERLNHELFNRRLKVVVKQHEDRSLTFEAVNIS